MLFLFFKTRRLNESRKNTFVFSWIPATAVFRIANRNGKMYIRRTNMALAISNIPILTDAVAESFVKNAEEAERNRGSIDFTRQHSEWSGFDMRNAARIAKLRAEGKWPF